MISSKQHTENSVAYCHVGSGSSNVDSSTVNPDSVTSVDKPVDSGMDNTQPEVSAAIQATEASGTGAVRTGHWAALDAL